MKKKTIGLAAAVCLGVAGMTPAFGQTKPAESTSKVKKVLLYNKIGGWVHVDGRRDIMAVVTSLSKSKNFALTVLEDHTPINLTYLKGFHAVIWNNNTDGGKSIPDAAARQAVLDYVNQGGGWLLIHGAGDHADSWEGLRSALGTKFTTHGAQGQADAILDPAAKAHPELKHMVTGIPEKFRLHDEWYSFQNTVRAVPNVTVLYTAGGGTSAVLKPPADGSGDYTYIWARKMGTGRMLYNAIGHGGNELMSQADSVASKLLWQNIRYVAGDFENGCTNANASNFSATARVDDGTCKLGPSGILAGPTRTDLIVVRGGHKIPVSFPHAGAYTVKLRDMRGALVWEKTFQDGSSEIAIGSGIKAGVYQFEARNGKNVARQRLVLP